MQEVISVYTAVQALRWRSKHAQTNHQNTGKVTTTSIQQFGKTYWKPQEQKSGVFGEARRLLAFMQK